MPDSIDGRSDSLGDGRPRNTGQRSSGCEESSTHDHAAGGELRVRHRFGSHYGRDETNLTTRVIIGDCLTNQRAIYQPGGGGKGSSEARAVDENDRPVRHCRLRERQSAI